MIKAPPKSGPISSKLKEVSKEASGIAPHKVDNPWEFHKGLDLPQTKGILQNGNYSNIRGWSTTPHELSMHGTSKKKIL